VRRIGFLGFPDNALGTITAFQEGAQVARLGGRWRGKIEFHYWQATPLDKSGGSRNGSFGSDVILAAATPVLAAFQTN
jgi:hypothetical protein